MNDVASQYSILYIEDEKKIRENYVDFLKRHFASVYEAEDGEKGYELYKKHKPELLLVDINLPKLNGIDLLRKIRQNDQATQAIMLTAHADTHYLLDATELNLVKYLVKPITRAALKEALNLAFEKMKNFTVLSNHYTEFCEGYIWNHDTKELMQNNLHVALTKLESKLLEMLILNKNIQLRYEIIIEELWTHYDLQRVDSLKTLIKKLRKKLPPDTITNIFGVGYKLN